MKKIAFPIIAAMCVAASAAHAAGSSNGGVLTVNGQLTANTCDVSGEGQGRNFTVTLPTLSASEFSDAGSFGGATGFSIALSNCTPATGNVHTFWESGATTLANGHLLNNGTATKVEVQLLDKNNGVKSIDVSKPDGSQNSQSVAIASGTANLNYAAQYISPTGGAGVGTVTTSVTYSLAYQ
ncbi:fimbrial protein [Caballeronia grimmiae]|uniref:Ferrous iron transporter B n=1 Tax=Caballeronia grimmiae TaxID=1071679 RepID=A0A069P9Q5_9BURK|nr:fimbrial protein [Caballeronia grimmiae]KDR37403.1 fimbrial protein [Caballeronia grimmiae]GGD68949.1 ferrous iron transporter B [Caballeronia grimmiae]